MANRKFFLGDLVQVSSVSRYLSRHSYQTDGELDGHCGVITKTTIGYRHHSPRQTVLYYTVQCECGQQLRPQTKDLDLIATPTDNKYAPVTSQHRLHHFLYRADIEASENVYKQVNEILHSLNERDRWILTMRYGIPGVLTPSPDGTQPYIDSPSLTLAAIGQELNLTRQRVEQIEKAALKRAHKNAVLLEAVPV